MEKSYNKSKNPVSVFFVFLKLYRLYQIAQRITYLSQQKPHDPHHLLSDAVRISSLPIRQIIRKMILHLDKTSSLRTKDTHYFFFSYVAPQKPVTPKTIARWVLSTLGKARINQKSFRAYTQSVLSRHQLPTIKVFHCQKQQKLLLGIVFPHLASSIINLDRLITFVRAF